MGRIDSRAAAIETYFRAANRLMREALFDELSGRRDAAKDKRYQARLLRAAARNEHVDREPPGMGELMDPEGGS